MKLKPILFAAIFFVVNLNISATFAALPDSGRISDELSYRKLTDGAFIVVHEKPWPANCLLSEMVDGSLVMVETPYFPETTRDLLSWIHAELAPRRIVAVNEHFHNDCLGGNEALREAGIPTYGTRMTARLLTERGEAMRAMCVKALADDSALCRRIQTQRFVPPDHLFEADSGLSLTFGTDSLILYYPGPAHAPDNIVAWFPRQQILFGGCMIMAGSRVGNTSDADLKQWPQSVERLRRFPARWIIPGHGTRTDPALIDHTLELLKNNHD
jgi:glyoxylase-like metal-dependent hydrolase (beta-lactamase superfamily II)